MKLPDFLEEESLWGQGYTVIGIDEVGRGAFAGPVGVGAVSFSSNLNQKNKDYLLGLGINDSKKLSAKKRLELSDVLKGLCTYAVEFVDVTTINEVGIGKATFLGMKKAIKNLELRIKNSESKIQKIHAFVDAFEVPNLTIPQTGIKFGDSKSISIAAASIIAKVERDKLMSELGKYHPQYNWDANKGYGTLSHRRAISKLGLTDSHREVFCKNIESGLLF